MHRFSCKSSWKSLCFYVNFLIFSFRIQTVPGCGLRCQVSNLDEMEKSFLQSPLAQERLKGSLGKRDPGSLASQVVIDTSMLKPTLVALNRSDSSKNSAFE